jgi:hypothetical protein
VVANLLEECADAARCRSPLPGFAKDGVEGLAPSVEDMAEAGHHPSEDKLEALGSIGGARGSEEIISVGPGISELLKVAAGLKDGYRGGR